MIDVEIRLSPYVYTYIDYEMFSFVLSVVKWKQSEAKQEILLRKIVLNKKKEKNVRYNMELIFCFVLLVIDDDDECSYRTVEE